MNARLQANVLRGWKPGWRTAIHEHIAATSNVPKRKRKGMTRADVLIVCGLLLLAIFGALA